MLSAACMALALLLSSNAPAIDCPKNPEQSRKDWEIEVRAAVGKIGPAKGTELETLTRSTTRDLVGKLPQADKVYLEQMMYATYCSALRDDPSLTESQKSARIKAYNFELRKTLHAARGEEPHSSRVISPKDAARAELARLPLPYTPEALFESIENGNLAAVKLFLAAGMDPNVVKDEEGNTPLMVAAKGNHVGLIVALLKAKARVNEKSQDEYSTALFTAAAYGHQDALRLLLDSGADNAAVNGAFLGAARYGHLEILQTLLKRGADKGLVSEALRNAAGYAQNNVNEGNQNDVVLFLLKQGADVNAEGGDEGWTALTLAVHREYALVAQTLLDAGANVNSICTCRPYIGSPGGWTALMIAAFKGDKAMVDILLQRGADPNLTKDKTALMIAAADDNVNDDIVSTVRVLLNRGANVNAKDAVGKTVLMIAAEKGIADTVRVLLDEGANVNAKDKTGATALMLATLKQDHSDKIRALLDKGADVNAKAGDGGTALMWAAMNSDPESLKVLLDAGADLYAKSIPGRTALMLAVREGRGEQVRALLRMGAKISDEDASGKTVMDYAEENEQPTGKEVLRILTKAGAK